MFSMNGRRRQPRLDPAARPMRSPDGRRRQPRTDPGCAANALTGWTPIATLHTPPAPTLRRGAAHSSRPSPALLIAPSPPRRPARVAARFGAILATVFIDFFYE